MNLSSLIFFFYGKDKYEILLFLPGCVESSVREAFLSARRNTTGRVRCPAEREGGKGGEVAVVLQESSVKRVAVITSR